jgi:hypothetical protein
VVYSLLINFVKELMAAEKSPDSACPTTRARCRAAWNPMLFGIHVKASKPSFSRNRPKKKQMYFSMEGRVEQCFVHVRQPQISQKEKV